MISNKYFNKPKFIHNLWISYDESTYYLTSLKGTYEVPKNDANKFLKIRAHCTGNHDINEISKRSGISEQEIKKIVNALNDIGLIRQDEYIENSPEVLLKKVYDACILWANQLEHSDIFSLLINDESLPINVLKGVMLENYHYIKDFPKVIKTAYENEENEYLKKVFIEYYEQELNHEVFILESLKKLGFSEYEVKKSIPLVSTQNIINLMKKLVETFPIAILFISKIIEVDDYNKDTIEDFRVKLTSKYDLSLDSLDAFLKHGEVDYKMGHATLFDKHYSKLRLNNLDDVSYILNALHDIKHAFDLQKLEILDYYQSEGNYIPRQRVDFFGV